MRFVTMVVAVMALAGCGVGMPEDEAAEAAAAGLSQEALSYAAPGAVDTCPWNCIGLPVLKYQACV